MGDHKDESYQRARDDSKKILQKDKEAAGLLITVGDGKAKETPQEEPIGASQVDSMRVLQAISNVCDKTFSLFETILQKTHSEGK